MSNGNNNGGAICIQLVCDRSGRPRTQDERPQGLAQSNTEHERTRIPWRRIESRSLATSLSIIWSQSWWERHTISSPCLLSFARQCFSDVRMRKRGYNDNRYARHLREWSRSLKSVEDSCQRLSGEFNFICLLVAIQSLSSALLLHAPVASDDVAKGRPRFPTAFQGPGISGKGSWRKADRGIQVQSTASFARLSWS